MADDTRRLRIPPEKLNTFFKIVSNARNTNKKFLTLSNHNFYPYNLIVAEESNDKAQEWLLYPLDTGYALVNRGTGLVANINTNKTNPYNVFVSAYTGGNNQSWIIPDHPDHLNDVYKLKNNATEMYMSLNNILPSPDNISVHSEYPSSEKNDQWRIQPTTSFTLPERPTDIASSPGPFPQYDGTNVAQDLPDETEPVRVGWSLVPAITIVDPSYTDLGVKLENSPYYLIEKYQYWRKLYAYDFEAGSNYEYSRTIGIDDESQTFQENDIGYSVSDDTSFSFKAGENNKDTGASSEFGFTNDVKTQMTQQLKTSLTQTAKRMQQITQDIKLNNNQSYQISSARYIKMNMLKVYRLPRNSEPELIDSNKYPMLYSSANEMRLTTWYNQAPEPSGDPMPIKK